MIIFRPQRGKLADSMNEAIRFKDEDEMKRYIVELYRRPNGMKTFNVEDIVLDDKVFNDQRIGWEDSRYVCIKKFGRDIYDIPQCIGMCATKFPQ